MSGVTLDVLLTAALTGRPYNQLRLGREAKRYARRITNRAGPDFPEDRHEKVCHEAFVALWMHGAAVRAVRRNYAAPGARTRLPSRKKPPTPPRAAAEDIGVIPDAEALARATTSEGEHSYVDLDQFASPSAATALMDINTRIDVERILATAPVPIAAALQLIHIDEIPVAETAKIVALSRFQLHRRIDASQAIWAAA